MGLGVDGLLRALPIDRIPGTVQRVLQDESRLVREWKELAELLPTLDKVRTRTMVPEPMLVDLARQVRTVIREGIRGNFVECGVWRGGTSFLMADLLRRAGEDSRKVWLVDSFAGSPPPQEIDGEAALHWQARGGTRGGFDDDYNRVSLEELRQHAAELGLARYTEFLQGWFEQTLPAHRAHLGPIAILRIDCDWYASVRCCLENLYDQVQDGGFVIIDDYFAFDGCALAVHEFFGEHRLSHRLISVIDGMGRLLGASFRKT